MHKTKLQQMFQQNQWPQPEYFVSKQGPGHDLRFVATVTANGESFQSSSPCRTSRGAQNSAAEAALRHLFGLNSLQAFQNENAPAPNPSPSVLPALHSDGLEANLALQSHTINEPQHPLTLSEIKDHTSTLDGGQWYKNRLQNYVQKRNLSFPLYSFEHQRHQNTSYFKCKVTVCGQSFESKDFFLNMREAENAAAKIAYEQLSVNEDNKVDSGLYKNALQELAHKRGFLSPSYKTESSGPGHLLTFISSVIVNDQLYQGLPAKSKKLAEVSAAKIAYDSLQGIHLGTPHLQYQENKQMVPQNAGIGSNHASPILKQEDNRDEKRQKSFVSC